MAIKNPFGSKSERKLERKQKRQAKFISQAGVNRAVREREGFMEESQRRRLNLNEQLARRGMSFGTHAGEEKGMFEAANKRALDTLNENVSLAEMGQDVTSYGYKVQKRLKPLNTINSILDIAETGFSMAGGMGGLGAGADPGGLSGADFDIFGGAG